MRYWRIGHCRCRRARGTERYRYIFGSARSAASQHTHNTAPQRQSQKNKTPLVHIYRATTQRRIMMQLRLRLLTSSSSSSNLLQRNFSGAAAAAARSVGSTSAPAAAAKEGSGQQQYDVVVIGKSLGMRKRKEGNSVISFSREESQRGGRCWFGTGDVFEHDLKQTVHTGPYNVNGSAVDTWGALTSGRL